MKIFSKKNLLGLIVGLFLAISFSNNLFATDASTYGLTTNAAEHFGTSDIPTVVGNIIKVVMGLSSTLVLGVLVYSGVLYFISLGKPDAQKKAIAMMKTTLIGIILIVTAYAVSQFIVNNIKFIAG